MADTQNPTPITPSSAAQPPQPVRPTAPPQTPAAAPTASPASPQISSRFLQNLQSVSSQPFQPVGSAPAPSVPPVASSPAPAPLAPSAPSVSPTPAGVPKESAAFAPLPSAGGSGVGSPPTPPSPTVARPAQASPFWKSPRGMAFIIGGLIALVAVLGALFFFWQSQTAAPVSRTPAPARKVTLTYWGLWESSEVMQEIIADYQTAHPNIEIAYVQQKSEQYRQRLQAAIRDGSGPDIFRFHNTWVPMMATDLAAAPSGTVSVANLQSDYYPIVSKNLVVQNSVVGVPLMYDGLALLYNQSMLEAANTLPPKDWEQVRALATQLAVRNGDRLERGGIALGTTSNVDNYSDILALMLLQNSAQPGNPSNQNAQDALDFYTIFNRTDKVWDDTLPSSTTAFATEKVAMIIVPSWRIFEIQQLNPNLRFGVTRVPQLPGTNVTWASYWAEGVNKSSRNASEAWKFLAYLSQPEQLRKLHTAASSVRSFGELYPRVAMAEELSGNALVAPYLEDALSADSWYLASNTHDEGINDQLIQYYTDAINMVNQRGNSQEALQSILPGIEQVLTRYGVSAQAAPSAPAGTTSSSGPISLAPER